MTMAMMTILPRLMIKASYDFPVAGTWTASSVSPELTQWWVAIFHQIHKSFSNHHDHHHHHHDHLMTMFIRKGTLCLSPQCTHRPSSAPLFHRGVRLGPSSILGFVRIKTKTGSTRMMIMTIMMILMVWWQWCCHWGIPRAGEALHAPFQGLVTFCRRFHHTG